MDTNNTFYEINTADVWQHERTRFFSGEADNKLAHDLLERIQLTIIKGGTSNFSVKDYDSGKFSKIYYERKINDYQESLKSIEEQFRLEYFVSPDDKFFSYYSTTIISKGDDYYDFWFALKLRQYDSDIFGIDNYLNFQFENNFESDFTIFIKFLKLNLRQYSDYFTNNIKVTVEEWIEGERNNHRQRPTSNEEIPAINKEVESKLLVPRVETFKENENKPELGDNILIGKEENRLKNVKPLKPNSKNFSIPQIAIAHFVLDIPITNKNATNLLEKHSQLHSVKRLLNKRITSEKELIGVAQNKRVDNSHLKNLEGAKILISGKKNIKANRRIERIIEEFQANLNKNRTK